LEVVKKKNEKKKKTEIYIYICNNIIK